MKTLIVVSTCERKELTGVCLSFVVANRAPGSHVIVIDDHSTTYDEAWLRGFDVRDVIRLPARVGVGGMALQRFESAQLRSRDYDFVVMLDNDALCMQGFDSVATSLHVSAGILFPGERIATTTYRSTAPENIDVAGFRVQKGLGGICQCFKMKDVKYVLEKMRDGWDHRWDFKVWKIFDKVITSDASFVEHLGRFGGGVNGPSEDRAVDFVGYCRFS